MWYDEFNSIFWLSLSTALLGCVALCGRQIYKSKCTEVSFCCLSVKRDSKAEKDLDVQTNSFGLRGGVSQKTDTGV
jgi:hypothetical protein